MTAQIITPNHWPRSRPVASETVAPPKVPQTSLDQVDGAGIRVLAERHLRKALMLYREAFSSEALIERLDNAATAEMRLIGYPGAS